MIITANQQLMKILLIFCLQEEESDSEFEVSGLPIYENIKVLPCLPTVVHLPKNDELLCVVCGIDSTAVITTKGAVYACGKNNSNKLGLSLTTLQSFIFMAFDSSSTSSLASTNLKIDIVAEPEEILALYASPNQIAKGEIVTLYDLCPLWLGLLVLVDTTVPLPKLSTLTFVEGKQNNENNSSCSKNSLTDTSESVPSWIKAEANNSWRPDICDVPSSLLNS
ncbi:uncharacterized protein LOC142321477 isoform X2 [Lycorma delicatula]|uniref:uncharacterized protein LOC142321477 isoform X2 n=1 Tax=Lycorma delicatula TaxID=130591 RepID=UPI003F5132B5